MEFQLTTDITLTQIYTLMQKHLLSRYEQKRLKQEENKYVILSDIDVELLQDKMAIYFEFLETLAFLGMEKNEIVISFPIIEEAYKRLSVKPNEKAAFFSVLKALGFIMRDSDGRKIEFIHLTIQEYFTARYLARYFDLQQTSSHNPSLLEFTAQQKNNPHYEIVWWFVAGLLKDKSNLLKNFFKILQSPPHDLAGLYQFNLQLHCLAECELYLAEEIKNNLLQTLEEWIQNIHLSSFDNPLNNSFRIPTKIINQQPIIAVLEAIITETKEINWWLREQSNLPSSIIEKLMYLFKSEEKTNSLYALPFVFAHQVGLSDPILQQLVGLLSHKDKGYDAKNILCQQSILPETVLKQVLNTVKNENVYIRVKSYAAAILINQAKLPAHILEPLLDLLAANDNELLNNVVSNIANYLWLQPELPEHFLQQLLNLLENKDVERYIKSDVVDIFVGQTTLPERISKRLIELLKSHNEATQVWAAEALSKHITFPEHFLKKLLNVLKNNKILRVNAAYALSHQNLLPAWIYEQLYVLLTKESEQDEDLEDLIVTALRNQTAIPENILHQLTQLLEKGGIFGEETANIISQQDMLPNAILQDLMQSIIEGDARILPVYLSIALSGQKQLPKEILVAISNSSDYPRILLMYTKNTTLSALCAHLNRDHYDDEIDIALLNLILLKCLEQKVPFYFYGNLLYVNGEAQGVFFAECQTQIIQALNQLFTETTAILATIQHNDLLNVHTLDQTTQFQGDPSMENITSHYTNKIRETITLNVAAIKNAIALIDDPSLQNKLIQSLKKSEKKATALNNQALNNEVFCQGRDAHIEMLQEELKLITESDEYNEFEKAVAIKQILPDLIFPFWCCRPFLKIETEAERAQNIAKEERLFNEQKAIRTHSTFIQALRQLKEDRRTKESRKPKFYFMYAWPAPDYAQRESEIQEFLGNLRQDLSHAGIEAIFDREDNFSGNNLAQFMGQILHEHAIVLVFGTESFRHKWFGHKTALQVEGDLLKLKWLTDFSERSIQPNQKTTIIPFVLTGIRETAIPEDLLPAKNPTVRALYNLSYKQIISSLLAVAYGITEQAVAKYINDTSDHIITIVPPNHSAPTNYNAVQPQTFFGRINHPLRNNNNIETHATASSATSMEIEEESNTNIPK